MDWTRQPGFELLIARQYTAVVLTHFSSLSKIMSEKFVFRRSTQYWFAKDFALVKIIATFRIEIISFSDKIVSLDRI